MNKILVLICCLFVTGCYTQKWAHRKIAQVDLHQPASLMGYCADHFSGGNDTIRDTKYLPGQEVIKYDTTIVQCPPTADGKPVYIKVPVEYKYRVDTIEYNRTVTITNTARVMQLEKQNEDAVKKARWVLPLAITSAVLFLACCFFVYSLLKPTRK